MDEELLGALQAIKVRDGIPVSEQVRRALVAWVEAKILREPPTLEVSMKAAVYARVSAAG